VLFNGAFQTAFKGTLSRPGGWIAVGLQLVDNRKDILLLLLYSPGIGTVVNEEISGRTRFMKMVFLFNREIFPSIRKGLAIDENRLYPFESWIYGPYSREVLDDLTFFILRGFIEDPKPSRDEALAESAQEWRRWTADLDESGLDQVEEYNEVAFHLTDKGCQFAAGLWASLTDQQALLIRRFKKKMLSAPLRALLQYVYVSYPEMTEKSIIKESVLDD
jgi:uncharacterized protein